MTDKQRDALFAMMSDGSISRCLASDIYAQGVTFSDLRAVVNLGGGGPYTNTVQKPGRLAEIRPGKVSGLMVDIMWDPEGARPGTPYGMLVHDAKGRYEVYKEKGYNIHFVHNREELRDTIAEIVRKQQT
jgi:superfamily II DNA/RNA helicase